MFNVALVNTKKWHFALSATGLISFLSLVQSVVLLNEEKTANYTFSLKHAQYLPAEKKHEPQLSEPSKNTSSLHISYGCNFLSKPLISTTDNKIGHKSWLERAGSHAGRPLLPECKSRGNRGEWALVAVFIPHDQKTWEQPSTHQELLNPPNTA